MTDQASQEIQQLRQQVESKSVAVEVNRDGLDEVLGSLIQEHLFLSAGDFAVEVSVYAEERYTHGDVPTGLTHAFGLDYTPDERWNFGGNLEMGLLKDKKTGAATDRKALGLNAGYNFGARNGFYIWF